MLFYVKILSKSIRHWFKVFFGPLRLPTSSSPPCPSSWELEGEALLPYLVRKRHNDFQELKICTFRYFGRTTSDVGDINVETQSCFMYVLILAFKWSRSCQYFAKSTLFLGFSGTKIAGTKFQMLTSLGWLCDVTKSGPNG